MASSTASMENVFRQRLAEIRNKCTIMINILKCIAYNSHLLS